MQSVGKWALLSVVGEVGTSNVLDGVCCLVGLVGGEFGVYGALNYFDLASGWLSILSQLVGWGGLGMVDG